MKKFLLGGFTAAGLLLGGLAVVGGPTVMGAQDKVTICHAAGQEGTEKFVSLTIPYNAAYGQAGHFNEDGTPKAGHEADYEGPCEGPPTEVPVSVDYGPATCEAPGTATPVEVPGQVEWTKQPDGGWKATALPGNVIVGTSTFGPPEPQLSGEEACPTTTTANSTPAVIVESGGPVPTPAAAEPAVTVAAAGPVPPAAAPAAAPAPAQTALPSTGSSSWGLALTALASLLGGLGLVKLSRRTS
jgi:LPXTG-motif cell wall-anchored protein